MNYNSLLVEQDSNLAVLLLNDDDVDFILTVSYCHTRPLKPVKLMDGVGFGTLKCEEFGDMYEITCLIFKTENKTYYMPRKGREGFGEANDISLEFCKELVRKYVEKNNER